MIEDKLNDFLVDRAINDFNYKVALRIREILYNKKIDIYQIAEFLNISLDRFIFMLSGKYNFSIRMISTIEVALQEDIIKIN